MLCTRFAILVHDKGTYGNPGFRGAYMDSETHPN